MSVYIDWSKAPEGTTHAYVGLTSEWEYGVPTSTRCWELWSGGKIYEWCGYWQRHGHIYVDEIPDPRSRIKKPEEKVMNITSLEQNIERMEKELAEMKAKLKACEKWEPKGGDWVVDFNGTVLGISHCAPNCSKDFGTAFQTKEQAQVASKLMRERNRIIRYVLEHVPCWGFEFVYNTPNYHVYYRHSEKTWDVGYLEFNEGQNIFMPKWVAIELVNDLKTGRVVL